MKQLEKQPEKKRISGFFYVMGGAALWGTLPVFSAFSYRMGSNALNSGAMRAYLSALLFLAWVIVTGRFRKIKRQEIPFYILYGIAAGGGTFIFYMLAIERLSTAMAAILLYTGPAFVILFNRLFYKEPVTKVKLAAVCLTFAGSFFVVKGYDLSSLSANLSGICFGLLSGISYSMTTVLGKRAKTLHDGRMNAALMVIFTAVLFLFVKPVWTVEIPDLRLWIPFLGLALLGTVLPYTFYLKGLDTGIDGGLASVTATLEPVVGTVLGVVILKDALVWTQVMGIGIVLTGIAVPILVNQQEAAGKCKSALPR